MAGSLSSDQSTVTSAARYDAYGGTAAAYTASGGAVGNTTWKYQGRLDVSPAGLGTPLYAMGARLYSPGVGAFTSLDTHAGSAQSPLSMNRWPCAQADPATLVDPTGHCAMALNWDAIAQCAEEAAPAAAAAGASEITNAAALAAGATWFTSCALGIWCPGLDATPLPDGQTGPHKMGPPPVATTRLTTATASTPSAATAIPAPTAGADPGQWLKSKADPTTPKTQPTPYVRKVEPTNPDDFPPGPRCSSMACKLVRVILGVTLTSAAASGFAAKQQMIGEDPQEFRQEIQVILSRRGPARKTTIGPQATPTSAPHRTPAVPGYLFHPLGRAVAL